MAKRFIFLFFVGILSFGLHAQDLNQTDALGKKQGHWIKKYDNGMTRYEGQFRNDQPYGTFTYYYPSDKKKAVSHYSDDGIIVHTTTFHENGNKMADGKYINRKKDSIWNYYSNIDGKLISTETYERGVLNGNSTSYYPESGKPMEVMNFINGSKEGPLVKYFPEGEIMTKGTYLNDKLDGPFTLYYPDGQIQVQGQYEKGEQSGDWKYFDENGKEEQMEDYKK